MSQNFCLYNCKNDSNLSISPGFSQEKLHKKGALTRVECFETSLSDLNKT